MDKMCRAGERQSNVIRGWITRVEGPGKLLMTVGQRYYRLIVQGQPANMSVNLQSNEGPIPRKDAKTDRKL
jgi:hypothetical protein